MNNTDHPSLFFESDSASIHAQSVYLCIQKIYLSLLILASLTGPISAAIDPSYSKFIFTVSAIILASSLILLWVIRAQRYDQIWFDCRAVAESVKTATWRYMMQTSPFRAGADGHSIDKKFTDELDEIRKMRTGIEQHLSKHSIPSTTTISDCMRSVRSYSLEEKKKFYRTERLLDQKNWYVAKSIFHSSSASKWFWAVFSLQMLALIIVIIQLATEKISIDFVSILMALVAVLVAWSQIKRHDELKQSYSFAAQELGSLESLLTHIKDEEKFEELVLQTENTISREHTMWCARRNVPLATS